MTAPYKLVAYEPGAANVVDRATGEKVGWVLQTFVGWEAFTAPATGEPIVLEQRTDPRFSGGPLDITETRTRAAAAQAVWDARKDAT